MADLRIYHRLISRKQYNKLLALRMQIEIDDRVPYHRFRHGMNLRV
jgi:hypothetical protein